MPGASNYDVTSILCQADDELEILLPPGATWCKDLVKEAIDKINSNPQAFLRSPLAGDSRTFFESFKTDLEWAPFIKSEDFWSMFKAVLSILKQEQIHTGQKLLIADHIFNKITDTLEDYTQHMREGHIQMERESKRHNMILIHRKVAKALIEFFSDAGSGYHLVAVLGWIWSNPVLCATDELDSNEFAQE